MLLRVDFKPLSPFKSFYESFTIFGAICWGIKILYGEEELKSMLPDFLEKPPFIISSPLPVYKGKVYFPRPHLKGGWKYFKSTEEYKVKKSLKKINYIDEETLKKILNGKIKTEKELWDHIKDKNFNNKFIKSVNIPHAKINRISWTTAGGELYNEETVYIAVPFSVFIYFYDESYIEKVKSALRFSQLGGNKSTGMGMCKVSFSEEKSLKEYIENKTDKFTTLSPVFPDESFNLNESYYEVFPVMSPVENFYEFPKGNIWKKRVVYIEKGSLIKVHKEKEFFGSLKKAFDDKDIYYYGFAFPLFVRS